MELRATNVSREICTWITEQGIGHVFLVPGLQIQPLCDEIATNDEISMIVACHELGAGFMADGYSRVMNKPGIALSIGGPGASYMLPSSMISRIDSSAVLYLTGDVPTHLKDHQCFQDTGSSGSRDREVYSAMIDFSEILNSPGAFYEILTKINQRLHKNLPAHLVIPCDIQESAIAKPAVQNNYIEKQDEISCVHPDDVAKAIHKQIKRSKNPLILVGHRLERTGAENLKDFAEIHGMRVATTLRARGILAENHPLSLGSFGYAGTALANHAILDHDCDFLLMLGANLSQRDTFNWDPRFFSKKRTIMTVDDHYSQISDYSNNQLAFQVMNINDVLLSAIKLETDQNKKIRGAFQSSIPPVSSVTYSSSYKGHPRLDWSLQQIRKLTTPETILFVDSGVHRSKVSLTWYVTRPGTFFISDFEGPMGWAICAAIGAKIARPDSPVMVLTGDGCMRMHAMEIATAVRYCLPIIYVISNNAGYYSILKRAKTASIKEKLGKLPLINWAEFANSIGAKGAIVSRPSELEGVFREALVSEKPYIIDLRTHPEEPISKFVKIPRKAWPDPDDLFDLNCKNTN